MMDATHIVIDLETLGTNPHAAIATIAVVVIEELTITQELYMRVDLRGWQQSHRKCDADTALFWMNQEKAARHEVTTREERLALDAALSQIIDLVGLYRRPCIWAKSPSFDCVILRTAFEQCSLDTPWKYWHERDIRTLEALFPALKEIPFEGVQHHALHDAKHEARQVIEGLRLLAFAAQAMQKPVATILPPDQLDERTGPWLSLEDWERLQALPAGTKLYAGPAKDGAA